MFVHVGIERRKRKPTEFYRLAILIFFNDDIGAGFLIFQFNFIPHQLDVFPARWVCCIRGNHEQSHAGTFFPANHLDNFVQSHLADIDVIGRTLCHSTDPVADLEASIDLRRTAGHQAFNFRVPIFRTKHGADAYERKAHVDAKILHIGLAQVFRMRVVCLGKRIEKKFDLLVLILLVHIAGEAIITASNQLRGGLNRMLAQMFLQ